MNYIFEEILSFLIFICSSLPGRIGIYSRKILYKFLIKNIGKDFYTENGVVFSGYKNIVIGNNVRLMRYSSINADDGNVKLGNNISITATIDGIDMTVPICEGNRHYDEIMRQVEAGELTIEEAD